MNWHWGRQFAHVDEEDGGETLSPKICILLGPAEETPFALSPL